MKKRTFALAGGLLAAAAGALLILHLEQIAPVGAAHIARTLCAGVFISGRSEDSVWSEELDPAQLPELRLASAEIDRAGGRVTARIAGLGARTALYRPGLGCTVLLGRSEAELRAEAGPARPAPGPVQPLPAAEEPALAEVVAEAFSEPDPAHPRRTRALLVMQEGRVIAERYAPGFGPDTPLLGWSMTKSVIGALIGVLVGEGRLALDAPAPVPEWGGAGDPRATITLSQLLRMESGLAFEENYGNPRSDVIRMLLDTPDAAGFAARMPLLHPPGSHWSYASGTSNILARMLALSGEPPQQFVRRALFEPLGMQGAVLEPDPAGTPLGSSYLYAPARDWARFGQLLLDDGLWQGRRLLPAGWVRFMATPAPHGDGAFGAHLWLRPPEEFRDPAHAVALPADTFHAVGFEGQFVSVIPSRRLVVVRLGLARGFQVWNQEAFLQALLRRLPGGGPAPGQ